jgi:DNA invertase Pin-like site-specific DNA recombinase
MRIAIYARVSTDDKGQDPENQLRQLRAWCAHAGHEIVHEYIDHETCQWQRRAVHRSASYHRHDRLSAPLMLEIWPCVR